MKTFIIGFIIGSLIGGMWVQFRFSGDILSNECKQKEEVVIKKPQSPYLNEPKNRCYFISTFGDVVKEEELNCDYYNDYYKGSFNTIHVDSLFNK